MDYLNKLATFLEEQGEVDFGFSDKYVQVFKRSTDGDFEGNIFDNKTDFINEVECEDGGIFTGESALEAIQFFTEDLL